MIARKFVFALIINLPQAPEQQTMLSILSLLPYIVLTYRSRPYTSTYLNTMDILGASMATSLAVSGLVMFGGYNTMLGPYPVSSKHLATFRFLPLHD